MNDGLETTRNAENYHPNSGQALKDVCFGVEPSIIPNPVPSATHSHFRTRRDDPTHQAIEIVQNPTWVLNWRSPHPPEKRAEKRTKMAAERRGRSLAVPVNPFETMRFSGGRIAGEKFPASQTGGPKAPGFEPSLFF